MSKHEAEKNNLIKLGKFRTSFSGAVALGRDCSVSECQTCSAARVEEDRDDGIKGVAMKGGGGTEGRGAWTGSEKR